MPGRELAAKSSELISRRGSCLCSDSAPLNDVDSSRFCDRCAPARMSSCAALDAAVAVTVAAARASSKLLSWLSVVKLCSDKSL